MLPFQLLDLILVGIMLISGLLALMRGFTREVLSLVAWAAAAIAAFFAIRSPELVAFAGRYLDPPLVAKIAVAAVAFLIALILVSLISVKIADYVLDSSAGAFDRTLGFVYGLARGLVLVVIAYLFYSWLTPIDRQEEWVRNAWSLPIIRQVGDMIVGFVPPDIAQQLSTAASLGAEPAVRSDQASPDEQTDTSGPEGYKKTQTQGLDQLIQGTQGAQDQPPPDTAQQPTFGGQSNPN